MFKGETHIIACTLGEIVARGTPVREVHEVDRTMRGFGAIKKSGCVSWLEDRWEQLRQSHAVVR
jgi:hypothetical protein